MVPGFPNFFMVYGPNTNGVGGLGVVDFEEVVARFALQCLATLILEGKRTVDVRAEAYWRFNEEQDRRTPSRSTTSIDGSIVLHE